MSRKWGVMMHRECSIRKIGKELEQVLVPVPIFVWLIGFEFNQYDLPSLSLSWKSGKFEPVYLQSTAEPKFDFQISDVEPGNRLSSYELRYNWGGNWYALTFTLQMRRNLSYHLVQTYVPSVLLVLITCLCCLLPSEMVEARIGVAMTTALTLVAIFSSIRQSSPEVSYAMAIDIWMVFCIFLVFLALVLFTLVHWLRRKSLQLVRDANSRTQSPGSSNLPSNRAASFKNQLEIEGLTDVAGGKRLDWTHKVQLYSRKFAFPAFAIIFLVFLVSYATLLSLSSGYYNWDPNPLYNADETGGQYSYVAEEKPTD